MSGSWKFMLQTRQPQGPLSPPVARPRVQQEELPIPPPAEALHPRPPLPPPPPVVHPEGPRDVPAGRRRGYGLASVAGWDFEDVVNADGERLGKILINLHVKSAFKGVLE